MGPSFNAGHCSEGPKDDVIFRAEFAIPEPASLALACLAGMFAAAVVYPGRIRAAELFCPS